MNDDVSDDVLFEAWRAGDQGAGETLFRRQYKRVRGFFYKKAPDRANELVQRTFLACIESKDRIREFPKFVFGVARIVLLRHLSEQRRAPVPLDLERDCAQDFSTSPTSVISERQSQRELLSALRRLPMDDQLILELYYWEQMTLKDIAKVMEWPEATTGGRFRRARGRLRKKLQQVRNIPQLVEHTDSSLDTWARSVSHAARASNSKKRRYEYEHIRPLNEIRGVFSRVQRSAQTL